MNATSTAGTAREGMTMDEWVDAPTGPGRWWRRVGDDASVLCDVDFGEATTVTRATRVDGLEVLYSTRPFAGVKWRRDVPVSDETTRLRALLEGIALPWSVYYCAAGYGIRQDPARSAGFFIAREAETGTGVHARLIVAAVNALPGLLDAAERAEREHREAGESTRAAWRESERREQEMRDRLIAAERERDDLAATLETRNAEHAAALRALSEARAVVDASMTFSDGVDPWCRRCGTDWADAEHPKRCIVGRLVAILGTTAEVPR